LINENPFEKMLDDVKKPEASGKYDSAIKPKPPTSNLKQRKSMIEEEDAEYLESNPTNQSLDESL